MSESNKSTAKSRRQSSIVEVVALGNIHNQSELAAALGEMGLEITQSTLSRDMNELGLVRRQNAAGEYIYALPEGGNMLSPGGLRKSDEGIDGVGGAVNGGAGGGVGSMGGFVGALRNNRISVKSIEFSSLFAVIKTAPGFANAVAAVIDENNVTGVMGTIAGDDTILVMIKDGFSQRQIIHALSVHIDGLK